MRQSVLSLFIIMFIAISFPSQSEARSLFPSIEEKQLEQQISIVERKISELQVLLKELRTQLCVLQNTCVDSEPDGAVLITEVLFNPGPTVVQGSDLDNEWVEIYNGTDVEIDLSGWSIGDGTDTDTLSSDELILGSGKHAVITRSVSTDAFWTYGPGTLVIHLESPIGSSGLTNAGESVILYDVDSNIVDAVSWGDDMTTMNPSVDVSGIAEGQSIERISKIGDTDSALDWHIQENPTPGA